MRDAPTKSVAALSLLLLVLVGCSSTPAAVGHVDERQATLNHGYALLYDFVSQNQSVDKVLILKSASEPTTLLIAEIAKVSTEATATLDVFAANDPALGYDLTGLPEVETQTRAAISSQKTWALLTNTGEAFEVQLLLTQVEGTGYAAALARTLIAYDDDENRKVWLDTTAERFASLHKQAVERLTPRTP